MHQSDLIANRNLGTEGQLHSATGKVERLNPMFSCVFYRDMNILLNIRAKIPCLVYVKEIGSQFSGHFLKSYIEIFCTSFP